MPVRTRIESIERDVDLLISQELSPWARDRAFAAYADEQIHEAREGNRRVLGRYPPQKVFVGGAERPVTSAKIGDTIVAEWELVGEVLLWIGDQLQRHSPVKTGRFRASHALFADAVEIPVNANVPPASEYVFINLMPYARKIERGASKQAPDGVYQSVAALARNRFGNVAKITYTFRTAIGGAIIGGRPGDRASERNPAIVVTLR